MNDKPKYKLAYILEGSQPVACTYVADKPYFYDSLSEIDMARAVMREVRDELIECQDILLAGASCCLA